MRTATLRLAALLAVCVSILSTPAAAQLDATTSTTPTACNGGSNGTATAVPTGGTPPYTYIWAPSGGNAAVAAGLQAGTYTVTVTDSLGATVDRGATVDQPPLLTATQSQTNVLCNGGSTGTATVNASGGVGGYTYNWSPSGGTAATATGRAAGVYSVTIRDSNLCQITRNFTITQPSVLAASTAQINMVCYGPNGQASVSPSGGTGPYTYSWSPGGATTQIRSGLLPGAHNATITDANGCSIPKTFNIISSSPQIIVNTSGTHATANGTCNGTATATASGGSGALTYSWAPSGGTSTSATNLCAANYTPNVTDANACQQPGAAVVVGSPASAPTIGAAAAAAGQVTVNFTPSASLGNLALGFYRATCGATTVDGPGSPLVVTGLANGTPVTCTVAAHNAAGISVSSAASNSATPATVPGAPTIGAATAGNAQATVTFTAPASNGGSAITLYTATSSPTGITGTCTAPCASITVNGLANGTAYTFTVTATSILGVGSPSAASNSVTTMTVPGAPTIGIATAANGTATVNFTAPASDGGSPITSYTVSCTPGPITATGATSPITVPGLVNGTSYQCSVRAQNSLGLGAASANVAVAPALGVFTGASATGTGTITASFTGGGAGCTFNAPQYIGAPPGVAPVPPTAPPNVTFVHGLFDFLNIGCTPGATVAYTIVYPAALRPGTQYWKYGPTPSNATPNWYTIPATIVGNTITFSITDGGLGDDDLAANGTIVDQGGPGSPGVPGSASAIPTLSQWVLIALALMMMGMAYRATALRRKR